MSTLSKKTTEGQETPAIPASGRKSMLKDHESSLPKFKTAEKRDDDEADYEFGRELDFNFSNVEFEDNANVSELGIASSDQEAKLAPGSVNNDSLGQPSGPETDVADSVVNAPVMVQENIAQSAQLKSDLQDFESFIEKVGQNKQMSNLEGDDDGSDSSCNEQIFSKRKKKGKKFAAVARQGAGAQERHTASSLARYGHAARSKTIAIE